MRAFLFALFALFTGLAQAQGNAPYLPGTAAFDCVRAYETRATVITSSGPMTSTAPVPDVIMDACRSEEGRAWLLQNVSRPKQISMPGFTAQLRDPQPIPQWVPTGTPKEEILVEPKPAVVAPQPAKTEEYVFIPPNVISEDMVGAACTSSRFGTYCQPRSTPVSRVPQPNCINPAWSGGYGSAGGVDCRPPGITSLK